MRGFIEAMIEEELSAALCRPRYGRHAGSPVEDGKVGPVAGHRHGHRKRLLTGTFGPTEIAVPRARLAGEDGKTTEWKSQSLAGVSAPHPGRGGADRLGLSVRNEHAAGTARFGGGLCQGDRQGHRQPDVAEGERRLGRLERPVVGGGADRSSDPRRDSGPRQARQEGDLDFPSCRARRQDGRSEGAVGREKHGRRKRGGLGGRCSTISPSGA